MSRPSIVVFAYSDVGYACLNYLIERKKNVVCVYTHRDKPGENLWFPSVAELAQTHSIPVRMAERFGGHEVEFLKNLQPELMFSFYYRNLLPSAALALPRLGAFNMHGSLLPKFRGRAPVNWAILKGERETGATLHAMVEKADAGDIVDQERVDIGLDDTARIVQARVTQAAVTVLNRQIENLEAGKATLTPQINSAASYFGKRSPEDGEISWNWPAERIHNLVRALSHPYPGAFGDLFGQKTWIWETRIASDDSSNEDGLFIVCADGTKLEILALQPEGRPETSGKEFLLQQKVTGRRNT